MPPLHVNNFYWNKTFITAANKCVSHLYLDQRGSHGHIHQQWFNADCPIGQPCWFTFICASLRNGPIKFHSCNKSWGQIIHKTCTNITTDCWEITQTAIKTVTPVMLQSIHWTRFIYPNNPNLTWTTILWKIIMGKRDFLLTKHTVIGITIWGLESDTALIGDGRKSMDTMSLGLFWGAVCSEMLKVALNLYTEIFSWVGQEFTTCGIIVE